MQENSASGEDVAPAPINIDGSEDENGGDEQEVGERALANDNPEPQSILGKVARDFSRLCKMARPEAPYCSKQYLQTVMQAVAMICTRCQHQIFDDLIAYVSALVSARLLRPVMMLHRTCYDETPIRLRVNFTSGADSQLGKVFVLQSSFAMLLAVPRGHQDLPERDAGDGLPDASNMLVLQGEFTPKVRATSGATGEHVAAVAEAAWQPSKRAMQVFANGGVCLKLVETDEYPGNTRAERLLKERHEDAYEVLHLMCAAHKVHASATRSFALVTHFMKGLSRTLLVLQQPGMMGRFKKWMRTFIRGHVRFDVVLAEYTPDTRRFKETLLKYFSPASPKKRALFQHLVTNLLNTDIREVGVLRHCCQGGACCQDQAHFMMKLEHALLKLASKWKPRPLNRGNWMQWDQSLLFPTIFCGVHGLLPLFINDMCVIPALALEADVLAPDVAEVNEAQAAVQEGRDDDEKLETWRKEQHENMVVAEAWLRGTPLQELYVLRITLHPEVCLMRGLLQLCEPQREVKRLAGVLGEAEAILAAHRCSCVWHAHSLLHADSV